MAPKREKSLLENPPAASSSDDEDVEDEEEEEGEEEEHEVEEEEDEEDDDEEEEEEEEEDYEEDEDEVPSAKTNSPSAVKKPKSDPTPNSGSKSETPSDDEEEEEDESEESDSEPTPSNLKPLGPSRGSNPTSGKPIVSQPKKTVSKPSTTTNPSVTATGKRPLESEKDSKRKKKKVDDEDSHPEETEVRSTFGPKSIFQRLWSDEDEIVVLRGLIESKKKGDDPFSDLGEFLESIKKSLHVEVRLDQLNNKIKRLKKKYMNNFRKGNDGEDPIFSKPHEVLSYELMKEIWGGKEGNIKGGGGGRTSNGKDVSGLTANGNKRRSRKPINATSRTKTLSLSDISMKESSRNGSLHPCVEEMIHSRNNMNMVGGSFLKQGLDLIEESKTKDLEQKWRSLYSAELQLYLRRVELVREQTIAILDAYKSSDTSGHE